MVLPATLKARFRIAAMGVAGARERVEAVLRALPGVVRVRCDPVPPAAAPATPGTVTVLYLPGAVGPADMLAALQAGGFKVQPL